MGTQESQCVSRRVFLKLGCGALLGGATTCALGSVYVTQIEPHWIDITRLDIPLSGLPEALDAFAIAQLGDFHVGSNVSAEDVRRSVQIVNDFGVDLCVLTGDFVYQSARHSAACATELSALRARYGVYAVLGNHDNWTDADHVAESLSQAGIAVLRDERRIVEVGDARLWLLGIEDTGYSGGVFGDFQVIWRESGDVLVALLEGIPSGDPRLLLVHNPDFTEMLPEGQIDLALCGHTHGGQVRFPFVGAPVVPSCFGQKYASGLVQGPSTLVYVNRGIGLIDPPVRLNCRPEVTLLRLTRG